MIAILCSQSHELLWRSLISNKSFLTQTQTPRFPDLSGEVKRRSEDRTQQAGGREVRPVQRSLITIKMIPITQSSGGQASDVGRPARNLSFSVAAFEGSDDKDDLLELNEIFTEDYYPPDLDYSMMSVLFDAFPAVTSHPQLGAGPGSRTSGAGQATQSKAAKRTTKTTKKRPAEDEADHEDAPAGSNPERK